MKITALALSFFSVSVDAIGFGDIVNKVYKRSESDAKTSAIQKAGIEEDHNPSGTIDGAVEDNGRRLNGCWGDDNPDRKWHPTYSAGWSAGFCQLTVDCNSPGYSSQLACCKGAYATQSSGNCLAGLPNPPTMSPTETGGLDVYYPNYSLGFVNGVCINERPLPNGRPTYTSQLACCKGAYAGQSSGACLGALPNPPTMSPTETGGLDVYYPNYSLGFANGVCINERPLPNGRPTYTSQLACCKGAYAGQMSGTCLGALPNPPTMSPTDTGGLDVYYPNYSSSTWETGTCINERPLPNGRVTYPTQLACCKGAYGGQTSGACLGALPNPPTMTPTEAGGLDVYYPDRSKGFAEGICINDRPLPNGRATYPSQSACCSGAYAGQTSQACRCNISECSSCACGSGTEFEGRCSLNCS